MSTTTLTTETFEQALADNEIVLVDFWATWCPPCRQFGPVFEASSQKEPEVLHAKVDIDNEEALANAAGIQAVPTLMAFREGIAVFQQAGALDPAQLAKVIDAVKGLDMVEVHAQIAQQSGD